MPTPFLMVRVSTNGFDADDLEAMFQAAMELSRRHEERRLQAERQRNVLALVTVILSSWLVSVMM